MNFTANELQIVVIIIGAVIIGKLISLGVEFTFKKVVQESYVTKSDCCTCRATLMERRGEINEQIKIIKGLLLVIAVKVGIQEEHLKDLIEK